MNLRGIRVQPQHPALGAQAQIASQSTPIPSVIMNSPTILEGIFRYWYPLLIEHWQRTRGSAPQAAQRSWKTPFFWAFLQLLGEPPQPTFFSQVLGKSSRRALSYLRLGFRVALGKLLGFRAYRVYKAWGRDVHMNNENQDTKPKTS